MAIIATEGPRFSAVVEREYAPADGFCRDAVVYNGTAVAALPVGTVLGKVTATGKYKIAVQTATDGSQNAAAVVIADVNGHSGNQTTVLNTDLTMLALTRGPVILKKAGLVLDASFSTPTLVAGVYAQLTALGMIPETSI